jgi:hypothetical protein
MSEGKANNSNGNGNGGPWYVQTLRVVLDKEGFKALLLLLILGAIIAGGWKLLPALVEYLRVTGESSTQQTMLLHDAQGNITALQKSQIFQQEYMAQALKNHGQILATNTQIIDNQTKILSTLEAQMREHRDVWAMQLKSNEAVLQALKKACESAKEKPPG